MIRERKTRRFTRFRILSCALLGALAMCTEDRGRVTGLAQETATNTLTPASSAATMVLVGAGDIAVCGSSRDEATATLLDNISGTVFTTGDNAYPDGSATDFSQCYEPSWGRHKTRTFPSPGNHDYHIDGAGDYFAYYGANAGPAGRGYYSYDIGDWHVVSLNSNIDRSSNSPQVTWLRADLAVSTKQCTVAYWHHARFSSGTQHGSNTSVQPMWQALYDAGAEIVVAGHEHNYERFAPQTPTGQADPATGIREFVVGTGGASFYNTFTPLPNSEVRNGTTSGVLKLTLNAGTYSWQFVPIAGQTFTDAGSGVCHGPPGGGGVSGSQSTVSASPASIVAGSATSTITVTARDGSGNPLSGVTVVLSATGSGNTLTQPAGTTNASGVATGTLHSTGAGQKTVSASGNGTVITQTATVTVTAGPLSASLSTLTASPTSIIAGGGSSTITVTAKDGLGNPISGATVILAATGNGNTLTQPTGATNASGVATGSLGSTVAETKTVSATINGTAITQTATVTVFPPGSGETITHSLLAAGSNAVNQKVYTTASISPAPNALITVAVLNHRSSAAISPTLSGGGMTSWTLVASVDFDVISLPHRRLTVFRAMSPTPGSGPITIAFTSNVSNAQWIVSQWSGVETSGVNGAAAIGQTGSNRSDGSNTLTASLGPFGNANNVAYGVVGVNGSGATVAPGSGFAEIAEQPSGESSALEAEWSANDNTIDASWASLLKAGLLGIEIKAGAGGPPPVSASQSTVAAAPTQITAGSGTSTVTVTARDGSGNPISGASVVLAATGGSNNLTQPTGTTNGSGQTTGMLSSTLAQNKVVSATINGVAINQTATVTVTSAAAAALAFTTQPSNTGANAPITPAVVVEIRDQYGNRVNFTANVVMAIGTNPASGTLSGTLTQAAVNGVATFSNLAINNAGTGYTLVASSSGVPHATSSAFNITPPVPSASLSTVSANPTSFTAGGGSTITVTVKDSLGYAMSGVTVTLSSTVGGDVITQPSSPTDVGGVTSGTVSGTSAGPRTITAVAGGVTLNQQPSVTVTAGAPSAASSTVGASPTSITAGSGSSTITVTVRDQYGNLVSGTPVVLAASGTGNALTQPAGPTNSSGVATGTLGSTVAETKTISATAGGTPISQTATVTVTPAGSGATITHTLLASGNNVVNQKIYSTATIAPGPNTLVTVAVLSQRAYGAISAAISGGGMSAWDQVVSVDFDTLGFPLRRMTIFRALSTAPGSGPITITFSANVSNCQWIVSQWDGVETSGVNGAGAIVQTGSSSANVVNGLTVTLSAFGNANNVAYGVFGVNKNVPAITPGAGFTKIDEQPSGENTPGDLLAEWAVNRSAINATWTNLRGGALGVEIKARVGP